MKLKNHDKLRNKALESANEQEFLYDMKRKDILFFMAKEDRV